MEYDGYSRIFEEGKISRLEVTHKPTAETIKVFYEHLVFYICFDSAHETLVFNECYEENDTILSAYINHGIYLM